MKILKLPDETWEDPDAVEYLRAWSASGKLHADVNAHVSVNREKLHESET